LRLKPGIYTKGEKIMAKKTIGDFYDKVGTAKPSNSRKLKGLGLEAATPTPREINKMESTGTLESERCWAVNDKTFYGVTSTYKELPSGIFRAEQSNIGPILIKQVIETDNLLELPDNAAEDLIAEFQLFWTIEDKFRERGFLRKRGFLLWGPPGSGKTSCVHILVNKLKNEHNGVVIFIDHPEAAAAALQMLRNIEPKRPLIVIMEDIDALVDKYGENEYLALLDGESQVDDVVFLATTNYPERLDQRFVDRPSRFDTVQYIGMPSYDARELYFKTKEPGLTPEELKLWTEKTDGLSIAHLKELIIAVKCLGQPFNSVIDRLEKMHARKPSSSDFKENNFGFLPRDRDEDE
jgi:hypothetical protein